MTYAAKNNAISSMRVLLTAPGMDPESNTQRDCFNFTALHHARYAFMAQMLIERTRLDINDDQNSSKKTPLHIAAENNKDHKDNDVIVYLTEELIKNGAKLNARDVHGKTPAHSAIYSPPVLRVLSKAGANLNIRAGHYRDTPLHTLLKYGNIRPNYHELRQERINRIESIINEVLYVPDIDIEAKDMDGQTALLVATWLKSEKIVKALVARGALNSCGDNQTCNEMYARAKAALGKEQSANPTCFLDYKREEGKAVLGQEQSATPTA